jgi:hypothetical protein
VVAGVAVEIIAGIIAAAYTIPKSINEEIILLTSLLVIISPQSNFHCFHFNQALFSSAVVE